MAMRYLTSLFSELVSLWCMSNAVLFFVSSSSLLTQCLCVRSCRARVLVIRPCPQLRQRDYVHVETPHLDPQSVLFLWSVYRRVCALLRYLWWVERSCRLSWAPVDWEIVRYSSPVMMRSVQSDLRPPLPNSVRIECISRYWVSIGTDMKYRCMPTAMTWSVLSVDFLTLDVKDILFSLDYVVSWVRRRYNVRDHLPTYARRWLRANQRFWNFS